MGKKSFQADQLIPTSSTPPPEAGFYRIDRHTIGVVGNMVFRDPNTQAVTPSLDAQIMQSAVSYDSLGRVSTANGWTYSYGASGLIESATSGSITRTYEYDAFGRYTGFTVS